MKIYGIGTDIININRINKSIQSKKFINRIFNSKEIKKCKTQINQGNCFAKRFAAKEAFVKALGTGFRGIYPSDISLEKDDLGKPSIRSSKLDATKHHLSITNTDSYTLSFVVIEK